MRGHLYGMREACEAVGLSYETLKYYCNEGLVPRHRRGANGHRLFDDRDLAWIRGLVSLRACGMSIQGMKDYLVLCLQGRRSIPARKAMLAERRAQLQERIGQLRQALSYIDEKQRFYDAVLAGDAPYVSNLLDEDEPSDGSPKEADGRGPYRRKT